MNNEQKPVAWMVRDGVVDYQLVKRKEQADHLVAELQKRHDLSGALAAFNAVALYAHPAPAVVAQLIEALDDLLYQAQASTEGWFDFDQAKAALAAAKGAGL